MASDKKVVKVEKQDCVKTWASKYKKGMAEDFLTKCSEGMSLPEISSSWGVTEEQIGKWRDDPKHKEFERAFKQGRTVCHAFHTALLKQLIGDGAAGPAINGQITILKCLFPETWNIATKQEVKKEVRVQDADAVNRKLTALMNVPSVKNVYKAMSKDSKVSPLIRKDDSENG